MNEGEIVPFTVLCAILTGAMTLHGSETNGELAMAETSEKLFKVLKKGLQGAATFKDGARNCKTKN